VLCRASVLIVHGRVQDAEGVVNVVGERFSELRVPIRMASRDFR